MKVRNPLGRLRLLSAITAAASPTLFSVAAMTSVATNCQTAWAQLQAPPTLAAPNTTETTAAAPAAAPQLMPGSTATSAGQLQPANPLRDKAVALAAEAKLAVNRGELSTARNLINQANALRVPDSAFAPNQLRPWQVAMDLERAEKQQLPSTAVQTAGGIQTPGSNMVQPGVFQANTDASKVQPASALQVDVAGGATADNTADATMTGDDLYRKGVDALTAGDRDRALQLFAAAWKKEGQMDPVLRGQLKDKLTLLTQSEKTQSTQPEPMPAALQSVSQEQALLRQKMFREVTTEIAEAERMVDENPMGALDRLRMLRQRVSQSNVEGGARKEYLAMVDRVINHIDAYVQENKAAIDQKLHNEAVEQKIVDDAAMEARVNADTQRLIDEFNELSRQQRFAEAEQVAKKVAELNPNTEIGVVMLSKARIQRRENDNQVVRDMKQQGFLDYMDSTQRSAVPTNPEDVFQFGDDWDDINKRRIARDEIQITPAERAIRAKLTENVSVSFQARPLTSAIDTISQMTGIPIIVDPVGMAAEGLTGEQPVSLELNGNSVQLKSALNLLLEPLNLTYVIKDEVLKITSRSTIVRQREVFVYHVADLVIPIPNFVSSDHDGFAGALQQAYQTQVGGLIAGTMGQYNSVAQIARNAGAAGLDPNSPALAQAMPSGMGGGGFGGMGTPMQGTPLSNSFNNPMGGFGGGGAAGGGAGADFQPLIDLIQTTIPGEWDTGEDSITEFQSNLSMIVQAPLETHEQIQALLKQLRALQNLQVTIEVKFISLSDTFFEKMGVDFDFNIDDNNTALPRDDTGNSSSFGLSAGLSNGSNAIQATNDLDIQYRSDSFSLTPAFGAFDAAAGASLGFAILSDLELFFFLNAAQGDSRTHVMQAPKVTMFDGQLAFVNDSSTVPFVVGLNPIVGDFAVAQQPIIVLLHDGTRLSVQSVVSSDRKFVRVTLGPNFSQVNDRNRTFTFTGSNSTDTGTTVIGANGDPLPDNDNATTNNVGSTVQLPTVANTSIFTTVTVPDGGTILLGGIKRLSEARQERGVPMLSKIPYINRLFTNTAVGREARTFMMTVTPRIIIPEEEEEAVLGTALTP